MIRLGLQTVPTASAPTLSGLARHDAWPLIASPGGGVPTIDLVGGRLSPGNLEPIRVFVDENGTLRTVDHRRWEAALRADTSIATREMTMQELSLEGRKVRARALRGRPDEFRHPPLSRRGKGLRSHRRESRLECDDVQRSPFTDSAVHDRWNANK